MKPCELNFTRFFSIFVCMKKLNDIELEELSYFPSVIYEEVIRPERKTPSSKKEKINNTFATVSNELMSYSVSNDVKKAIQEKYAGDKISIKVMRNGREKTINVELTEYKGE